MPLVFSSQVQLSVWSRAMQLDGVLLSCQSAEMKRWLRERLLSAARRLTVSRITTRRDARCSPRGLLILLQYNSGLVCFVAAAFSNVIWILRLLCEVDWLLWCCVVLTTCRDGRTLSLLRLLLLLACRDQSRRRTVSGPGWHCEDRLWSASCDDAGLLRSVLLVCFTCTF